MSLDHVTGCCLLQKSIQADKGRRLTWEEELVKSVEGELVYLVLIHFWRKGARRKEMKKRSGKRRRRSQLGVLEETVAKARCCQRHYMMWKVMSFC